MISKKKLSADARYRRRYSRGANWEAERSAVHADGHVVSKSGNLRFVGPMADATIPMQKKPLLELGAWLRVAWRSCHSTHASLLHKKFCMLTKNLLGTAICIFVESVFTISLTKMIEIIFSF